jgi:1-deoxy-D-xylulose-5-phosphate synthase
MKNYKFLNDINFPSDLRKLSEDDLQKVSDEVREEMIVQFLKLEDI